MKDLKNTIILREFFEDTPDDNLDVIDPDKKTDDLDKKTKTYSEDEMKKAIERRQAALKRAQNAEAKAKALEEKVKSLPDEDELEALREDYTKMKQQLSELDEQRRVAELEKIEDEKERERVKLQREFEKERAQYKTELEKLQEQIVSFNAEKEQLAKVAEKHRGRVLEASILNAASGKAFNPQQVVRLIKGEFVHDDKDDTWYKQVYNKDGKLTDLITVEEYVEAFLNDATNENLLKASIKSGSDTPRGNTGDSADSVASEEPTDEMYRWAEDAMLSIDRKSSAKDKAWLIDKFNRLHKRVKKE
jgi:hypothetical protein